MLFRVPLFVLCFVLVNIRKVLMVLRWCCLRKEESGGDVRMVLFKEGGE